MLSSLLISDYREETEVNRVVGEEETFQKEQVAGVKGIQAQLW